MLQFLGRLHPLLVHFPIALLLAALLFELRRGRASGPSEAGFACLALGTLGAFAAALTGWLFAAHDPPGAPDLLLRHRWSGVGTAAASGAVLLSAWRWKKSRSSAFALPTRLGLAFTALLTALSGTLGGAMVYGEGFLLEPLRARPSELERGLETAMVAAGQAQAERDAEAAPRAAAPIDHSPEIRALFERRCTDCHGERKRPKGNLKLTDLAAVLAREPSEAVIVPGDPAASPLFQRITLPSDHEDVMPPEGEEPLSAEEIELVRRWIAEGARWSAPGPGEPGGATLDAAPQDGPRRGARDAALARLRARGARAQRLAQTSEDVEVDLGVAFPRAGDAELALLAGLEPFLVELVLARTAVTDEGLATLARFTELRRLRLEHTAIGDEGLGTLAGLGQLESLNLFGTRVTDAGMGTLGELERLRRLYVGGTALSAPALVELERARPDLWIERGDLPDPDAPPDGSR
jgi:uncharacterized membrane protein